MPQEPVSVPICVLLLSDSESEKLEESRFGFESFSVTRLTASLAGVKKGDFCLVISTEDGNTGSVHLCIVHSKRVVATTGSQLKLSHGRSLDHSTPDEIRSSLRTSQLRRLWDERVFPETDFVRLSKKLGEAVCELLRSNNPGVIEGMLAGRTTKAGLSGGKRLQATVLRDVLSILNVDTRESPDSFWVRDRDASALTTLQANGRLLEDRVIEHDARYMPGWELAYSDMTGFAEYRQGGSVLTIFTANRGLVERATGADLIYINYPLGNAVLIQYKMFERERQKVGGRGSNRFTFRPDGQFRSELSRMKSISLSPPGADDYRLNSSPFFFKFVRRIESDLSNAGSVISLEHLEALLDDPKTKGAKGGICLDFSHLEGRYLRKVGLVELVRSGYVGSSRLDTRKFQQVIDLAVAKENSNAVIACEQDEDSS